MNHFRSYRRRLLKTCLSLPALTVPAIAMPMRPAPASVTVAAGPAQRISFFHIHTRETLDVVYREGSDYLPDALERINRFLRDFRTHESHVIQPQLLDQLFNLQSLVGSSGEFQIISGYRSLQTNELLRSQTTGVAKHSLHTQGRAIDVRLTDVRTQTLRAAAIELGQGGVGYYPQSDFLHLDTGRFRTW
jgi:uncharacterized protein YcbK (DUF882 family)